MLVVVLAVVADPENHDVAISDDDDDELAQLTIGCAKLLLWEHLLLTTRDAAAGKILLTIWDEVLGDSARNIVNNSFPLYATVLATEMCVLVFFLQKILCSGR